MKPLRRSRASGFLTLAITFSSSLLKRLVVLGWVEAEVRLGEEVSKTKPSPEVLHAIIYGLRMRFRPVAAGLPRHAGQVAWGLLGRERVGGRDRRRDDDHRRHAERHGGDGPGRAADLPSLP